MSVVWTILAVGLAIFAVVRFVLRFQRLAAGGFGSRRFFIVLIVLGFIAAIWACLFVSMEYVINKGPDDLGVLWHAGYPLSTKYGKMQRASYIVQSYNREPSGSGTYHIQFEFNGHRGEILSHYNKSARTFDHDDIKEQP